MVFGKTRLLAGWGAAAALLCVAAPAPAKNSSAVTPVDAAGLKRAVAARKGKVVLVNFWATWCIPCVEEFPDLVRLHNKYKAQGLDFVPVSVDMARDVAPKVQPF